MKQYDIGAARPHLGRRQSTLAACWLVSTALWPTMAQAQAAVSQSAGNVAQVADGTDTIADIVVTAERRETRLQNTPISITAFTADTLVARGITNVQQLNGFAPNLQINPGRPDGVGSSAQASIRGIGQQDFLFPNDPGVGTYVDGVYVARTIGGLASIVDVERIEVLRGPQGTLYGRNTIGGAINIITSRPSFQFGGRAELTLGDYNRREGRLSVQFPVVNDLIAAKIAVGFTTADGYGRQIITGEPLGDEGKFAARIGILVTPVNNLEILINGDYSRQRQHGQVGNALIVPSTTGLIEGLFNPAIAPAINAGLGLPAVSRFDQRYVSNDPFASFGTTPTRDWYDAGGASITATLKASSELTLKSITAVRSYRSRASFDADHTPYNVVATDDMQHGSQVSQEFQAAGTSGDKRLTYIVGLFLFREKAVDNNDVLLADGTFAVTRVPALDLNQVVKVQLRTNNIAGFGQLTYKVLPRLAVTVGARENYEKKLFSREAFHPNTGEQFVPFETLPTSSTSFTPRIGLDWQITTDNLIYGSFAKGFKSGGFNPRPISGSSDRKPFGPEKITTFEIGSKNDLFGRRATLNVAVFKSKYTRIQLPVVRSSGNAIVTEIQNGGDNDIYGAEVELNARPAPGTTLQLRVGYLHNRFTSISPGSTIPISAKLPDAPEWTINAGLSQQVELAGFGRLTLRGDAAYQSRTFKDAVNTPALAQDSYIIGNLRASFVPEAATRIEVSLYAKNIGDARYVTNALNADVLGFLERYYGRPREIGGNLRFTF